MIDPKRNIQLTEFDNFSLKDPNRQKGDAGNDKLIWESFKNGNQKALAYIFKHYANFLFNYGYQFTSDRNLIKDCLQDIFLDLIRHRKNLKATDSIKFYLMKCLRNKVVNTLQKNAKREQVETNRAKENEAFMVSISSDLKMINGHLDSEKQRLIEEKINELPALQREATLLYFYEGLKYSQIAELLGIKVKSSRALIYRSLESLKDLLAPYKGMIFLLSLLFHF